jgi:hypothetical protein
MSNLSLRLVQILLTIASHLATLGLYSNVRGRLDELYLLLPLHRQNARFSLRGNTFAYCSTILPSILVFHSKLMAFWTLW